MGTVERERMAQQPALPHVTSYSTVATRQSTTSGSYLPADDEGVDDGIKRKGVLRKLKTGKKKYFVLRKATHDRPALLEYYDQVSKYQKGETPKRTIIVGGCFAVNKKEDSGDKKDKYAISIYGNPDTFSIVAASEQEQMDWLRDLVELQQTGNLENAQNSPTSSITSDQPYFDYVWNVEVEKKKGATMQSSIVGPQRLCVQLRAEEKKNRFVKLFPVTATRPDQGGKDFPLKVLRQVGVGGRHDEIFYLEVGRSAVTGAESFAMVCESKHAAAQMHDVIGEAMRVPDPTDTSEKSGSGHRTRSNTDHHSGRSRASSDARRNTYESDKTRHGTTTIPQNEMGHTGGGSAPIRTGSGSTASSRERLARSERIENYITPAFQQSTSVNETENYLPVDLNNAYFTCDFPGKPEAPPPDPNYATLTPADTKTPAKAPVNPRGPPQTTVSSSVETARQPLTPSIPEEPSDYAMMMPTKEAKPVAPKEPVKPAAEVQQQSGNSLEESGYFEMNVASKDAHKPVATTPVPAPSRSVPAAKVPIIVTEKASPAGAPAQLPADTQNSYMMMTPSSAATTPNALMTDSRRSTMSNASYQSHGSEKEEHADTVGEVTYAVMEPSGNRSRRGETSSREASTSSLGSSFGWDRLSSVGSRTDYKLDKVRAFMAVEDEGNMRGLRAYSIGCTPSKPVSAFKVPEPPAPSIPAESAFRIRAFSLGNHSLSPNRNPRRVLPHSPSAALVLNSSPSTSSPREVRHVSVSDTQLTPESSERSTPDFNKNRKQPATLTEENEESTKMELDFRKRSGT
ncbi:hypothetical protein RvY_10199 [Ramazzottius varieornatus]|uniref:Insulin receptor substrate 1 n=1 Tax=Ramazzottius varieornatus TaxID=947166 RepID=A0A1D1VBZ2_RAMVA|nr:hypothetical protein RvY_10199 [Ramazzottius varieornatus]